MSRTAEPQSPPEARGILDFWFGDRSDPHGFDASRQTMWFRATAQDDRAIRERFGEPHRRALAGGLEGWRGTAEGALAMVILLDQFSRQIHRGTAAAFAGDAQARSVTGDGIDRGMDRGLRAIERVFFYMPLHHAEDRACQRRCIALTREVVESVPEARRQPFQEFLDYAEEHAGIVERFGRFPHRNRVLGRNSTPEEQAYLEAGARSYGQG